MKTKDESCALLESILLEIKHIHAKHHAQATTFAPVLKFDSDTVFEAAQVPDSIYTICTIPDSDVYGYITA
jgi:hypothetical protein